MRARAHTPALLPITATMPTLYFSLDFTVPVTTGHIDRTVLAALAWSDQALHKGGVGQQQQEVG